VFENQGAIVAKSRPSIIQVYAIFCSCESSRATPSAAFNEQDGPAIYTERRRAAESIMPEEREIIEQQIDAFSRAEAVLQVNLASRAAG